jgi:outer membrane murein-binding lipoprotein Lpp
MKRFAMVLVIVVISSAFISGCAKMAIEKTISEFEDAVNNMDAKALEDIMSTESTQTTVATYENFLKDNFSHIIPVDYKNLDIDINGRDADVYADATYIEGEIDDDVKFWMRREEALFSFLFPDWRIYQYFANGNFEDPIWLKTKEKPVYVE